MLVVGGVTFPMLVFNDSTLFENHCQFLLVNPRSYQVRKRYFTSGDILLKSIQKYTQSDLREVSGVPGVWEAHIGEKDLSHFLVRIRNVICRRWSHSINWSSPIRIVMIIDFWRFGAAVAGWRWCWRSQWPSVSIIWSIQIIVRRHFSTITATAVAANKRCPYKQNF